MSLFSQEGSRCHYHPDRGGVGVCVKCRTVICEECSTRFKRANHCSVCVARLQEAEVELELPPSKGLVWSGVLLGSLFLILGGYAALHMLLLW